MNEERISKWEQGNKIKCCITCILLSLSVYNFLWFVFSFSPALYSIFFQLFQLLWFIVFSSVWMYVAFDCCSQSCNIECVCLWDIFLYFWNFSSYINLIFVHSCARLLYNFRKNDEKCMKAFINCCSEVSGRYEDQKKLKRKYLINMHDDYVIENNYLELRKWSRKWRRQFIFKRIRYAAQTM